MALPDPLLSLRAALCTFPDEPLKLVQLRSSSGDVLEDIAQAAEVVVQQISNPALQHDEGAPEIVYAADTPTRVLRTRETASQDDTFSPEASPDLFFSLKALVFAVQQRSERAGAYLRNAGTAQIVPLPALERPAILEYLLGKREAWEGIVSSDGQAPSATAPAPAEGDQAKAPGAGAPAQKRAYVPDAADAEFVRNLRQKYEVVLLDRNDALSGSQSHLGELHADTASPAANGAAPSDVFGLRALLKPRLESAKRRVSAPAKSNAPAARPGAPSNQARRSRAQDPIILLSNSPTALVNMFNVKSLLQDGVFIPPDEARRQANGVPELVVTIQTRSEEEASGSTPRTSQLSRRILVVDSAEAVNRLGNGPAGSGQDPWNRVIAVFTTGQTWQFKSYRWSDPRDLFKNGRFLSW